MSIFNSLNKEGHLDGLEIDVDNAFNSLGIGNFSKGDFSYVDLSNINPDELEEIVIRTVGWSQYLNNVVTLTDKRRRDAETRMEAVINKLLSQSTMKVTEAKAAAKGSEAYINANYQFNTLEAYHDYLERVMSNLDKFHYIAKQKLQILQGLAQKERNSR